MLNKRRDIKSSSKNSDISYINKSVKISIPLTIDIFSTECETKSSAS